MISQPCCRVDLVRPQILLIAPVFWSTSTLCRLATVIIHRQEDGCTACKRGHSCVRGIEITFCFALLVMIDLVFSETSVNNSFVYFFISWYLSYGKDETRTQNPLIPGWKPNSFGNKDLYMHSTLCKYCSLYLFLQSGLNFFNLILKFLSKFH